MHILKVNGDIVAMGSNIADMKALYEGTMAVDKKTNTTEVRLVIDPTACASLSEYLQALNIEAKWYAKNPQEGVWVGGLVEDLDHWAGYGITTPAQLADYLDACVAKEMEEADY